MTQEIWKFEISPPDFLVKLPRSAVPLSVGVQNQALKVWALIDMDANMDTATRKFPVYGTGFEIHHGDKFMGTVFMDELVWHVFDAGIQSIG